MYDALAANRVNEMLSVFFLRRQRNKIGNQI